MKKQADLPIETHQRLGNDIREIVARVENIRATAGDHYGEDIEVRIKAVGDAVEKLRCYLDLRVFIEHPERDGNANAEVYYAGGHKCDHHGDDGCGDCGKDCSDC